MVAVLEFWFLPRDTDRLTYRAGQGWVPYGAAEAWETLRSHHLLAQFTSQKERPRRDSAGICHILRGTDVCCALSVPSPSKCAQGVETTAGAQVFDLGHEN